MAMSVRKTDAAPVGLDLLGRRQIAWLAEMEDVLAAIVCALIAGPILAAFLMRRHRR